MGVHKDCIFLIKLYYFFLDLLCKFVLAYIVQYLSWITLLIYTFYVLHLKTKVYMSINILSVTHLFQAMLKKNNFYLKFFFQCITYLRGVNLWEKDYINLWSQLAHPTFKEISFSSEFVEGNTWPKQGNCGHSCPGPLMTMHFPVKH